MLSSQWCAPGKPCDECTDPACKCYHHKLGKGRKKKAKYIKAAKKRAEAEAVAAAKLKAKLDAAKKEAEEKAAAEAAQK